MRKKRDWSIGKRTLHNRDRAKVIRYYKTLKHRKSRRGDRQLLHECADWDELVLTTDKSTGAWDIA